MRARTRSYPAVVSLEAETEGSRDRMRAVMIPRNLAVIANGSPDSGCDLDANVRVNEKRVVSKVRRGEGSLG